MTRKELAVAMGGLMLGAGCASPAEQLALPAARAVEPATVAPRINRMYVNLNVSTIEFNDKTNECLIGPSPNTGWTWTIANPNIVEVKWQSERQNDAVIKAKSAGTTDVRFFHTNYGSMHVTVHCR